MPLRTVRILCFGDSLTSGYTNSGCMYHPYAHTMMKTLRMAFPEVKLDISVKGEPGDKVMPPGGFQSRMEHSWKEVIKRDEPYSWVLILGGTNDIVNSGLEPEKLFDQLTALYDVCFTHGAKVIGMTIPECSADLDWLCEKRDAVNKMITNHSKDNFHVFDLHAALPNLNLSSQKRKSIWDDGVHPTTTGYSIMGDKVAEFFLPLLKEHIDSMPREQPPSPVSPSTVTTQQRRPSLLPPPPLPPPLPSSSPSSLPRGRKKAMPTDNLNFEEEVGDPDILSQGYIVIRKRDLD